jgi:hypothetical protein
MQKTRDRILKEKYESGDLKVRVSLGSAYQLTPNRGACAACCHRKASLTRLPWEP